MTTATQAQAVIVIRMMPPRECSPNHRGYWMTKAFAANSFRQQAGMATKYASTGTDRFLGSTLPVVLDAEIAWCCGRKRLDDDNAKASLKAAIDGISDVLWGGQDRHVTIGTVMQTRGNGTVTITLRQERVL